MGRHPARPPGILPALALALLLIATPVLPLENRPEPAVVAPDGNAPTGGPSWWEGWSRSGDARNIDEAILRIERDGISGALAPDGTLLYRVRESPGGILYDVFVRYRSAPDAEDAEALAAALGVGPGGTRIFALAEAIHVVGVPFDSLQRAIAFPDVVAVELERRVEPMLDKAAASAYVVPHRLTGEGARERWKVTGRGVVIAVLDTGIDKTHEAIPREHYIGGYNATIPTGRIGDELLPPLPEPLPQGTWTPLNEIDPADDDSGHGTHVTGIALGTDPNGTYTGMAPDARFLDVKVLTKLPMNITFGMHETGGGPSDLPYGWGSFVIEGMEFVKRYNRGESHFGAIEEADRIRIALMALGELEPDERGDSVLSHAANRLVDAGVIVVAPGGNCGPKATDTRCVRVGDNTIVAPGAALRALTVGSLNHNETADVRIEAISGSSSVGPNGGEPKPNLVAYGEPITGPVSAQHAGKPNAYMVKKGTSMAAAQIAGIAALVLEIAPESSPEEVKDLLMQTAREKGTPGWDATHGAGAVDALLAVGVAFGVLDLEIIRTGTRGQTNRTDPPAEAPAAPPVVVNRAPVVQIRHQPAQPLVGESVVFIDMSRDPEGDKITAYAWDFGDGNTGKGERTAHTYLRAGEYRVVLTATDVHATAGSGETRITVFAAPESGEATGPQPAALLAVLAIALTVLTLGMRRRTCAPGATA